MGEGFMGGCTPPFTIFFDFRLRSLRYEKDFLPVLSKLSQASMVKIFHFSDEWKVVSVAPQRGGVHPPINLEVFFTHILATATRLNTSYGLETLHAQLSRHVGITQKVLRHIRHFWRIYDVINVGFFRHFAVFCYRKCHKVCRNSWFSHRICVLIGSTTLPSLKCNRLCVAELWRHIRRKSAISSTSLFKMTDF